MTKKYNKETDPLVTADFNWKIALTDLIHQVKYLKSESDLISEDTKQADALEIAMKYMGFDLNLPYFITKESYKFRNLENKVVETPLVYGFADQNYLDVHKIKTVEYMLVQETDKYLRNELKRLHTDTSTTNGDLKYNSIKMNSESLQRFESASELYGKLLKGLED